MRNISIKLSSVLLNIAIPGAGLFALGYKRAALFVQLALIVTVATICWSRAIFTVPGLSILLATILVIYIVSTISCIWLEAQSEYSNPKIIMRHALMISLFLIFFSSLFMAGFIYKDRLFGVHLFFVPSDSMTPALLPGDFILVDTWQYKSHEPSIGDVVVFTLPGDQRFLVKRISPWPETVVPKIGGKYFMRGDNQKSSRDSRFFGGIEFNRIIGKAKLVLYSINPVYQFSNPRMIKAI